MERKKRASTVVRDAAWVQREYGREKWPDILSKIKQHIASGERSLSRVLTAVTREELGKPGLAPVEAISFSKHVQIANSIVCYGFYALVAEAVIAACQENTQAIVDLGCGWGRSLFEVWLRGGPSSATYYGFDVTRAGIDCVEALAQLEPAMKVRTAEFDLYHPNYSLLSRPLEHAVVFTVSSVHQLPTLETEAYNAILEIAKAIDCLHFEQIGWQMQPGEQTAADREYALRNDYNKDLWRVLSELSSAGKIEFREVEPDVFGMQGIYPLTLVHWRKAQ